MRILIELVAGYAKWVYLACAAGALWYLRVVYLARRERRSALFALEKEAARNQVYSALGGTAIIVLVMAGTYIVANQILDIVPEPAGMSIMTPPTPILMATPTPTPEPTDTPTVTPTFTPRRKRPTPKPAVTPTPEIKEQAPACPDSRAVIQSPGVGAVLGGPTQIIGTAQHEAFQFYKLEFGIGPNPTQWSYFDGGKAPVANGVLGVFTATVVPNGVYTLRLVVVDKTGNFPPPCQVTVTVQH